LNGVAPKPHSWMTDMTWLNLVELTNLAKFQNICTQVTKNERFWKMW
jgi:dynein heavy chain